MSPDEIHGAPLAGASAFADDAAATLVFDDVPRPGTTHMAGDAARFAAAEASAGPLAPRLRWFTWDRPTLSLGRLESPAGFDAAALAAAGIPIVIRPTGGRAVLHVDEWTYAALIPLDHPTLGGSLAASTRALTSLISTALAAAFGIACDPAADARNPSGPGTAAPTCFARSFGYELGVGERKLMGSAQRRGRRVLLQQGSLLVGPGHERITRMLASAATDPMGTAGAEADLRARTTNLTILLGGRPDSAAFRAALARAWNEAVGADRDVQPAQGSGQADAGTLDSFGGPS